MAGQKTDERDVLLGRRIAERRKGAKLTQRNVAKEFGMSAAQLQKYEKGTNRISAIHLGILSRLTDTPIEDFLDHRLSSENEAVDGFAEAEQRDFVMDDAWAGLAEIVAHHVAENFEEHSRREFTAVIEALHRQLKR